ncbi:MAG: hypothetical protein LBH72_07150 [Proteiniphilum sp.]|jgi:hypothetical protein|nr:hypothetical protein [Proteiniphilum sp.]
MKKYVYVFKHVLAGVIAIAGFSAVTMLMWNWLMPDIFGLATVNFWQATGMLVLLAGLSKFMVIAAFLGMRGYRHNPIHDKWMKMSPEQRKEFISRRREHIMHRGHFFGGGFDFDDDSGKVND